MIGWKVRPCRRPAAVGVALVLGLCLALPMTLAVAQDVAGFRRGDCNGDANRNISDVIFLVQFMFQGTPLPGCIDACDMNDSGDLDLADVFFGLDRIFLGPVEFPVPHLCGVDPSGDLLDCQEGNCTQGPLREEGSFTLETARVGLAYSGDLPAEFQSQLFWQENGDPPTIYRDAVPYEEYGLALDQALPPGLLLDPATGLVSGVPLAPGLSEIAIWARHPDGDLVLYHVDLPVFSLDETELVPDQNLEQNGSFIFTFLNDSFTFTHELPWPPQIPLFNCSNSTPPPPIVQEIKGVQVIRPVNVAGRVPVLFFHHGSGFDWNEYSGVLTHFASHGIITVSVNDPFPFFGFVDYYCWGGHDEAAKVLVAARELVRTWTETPGHPLHERVDWTRVFYGGHSRGGGVAMVVAEDDRNARGLILLQGTDAKQDSQIGNTSRWVQMPDVPVLSLSAEQDFDVVYPFAERLLERFRGPTTMVTIYGGCHGFTSDASLIGCDLCDYQETGQDVDRCRYITRDRQQELIKRFGTAFLRRYGFGDVSTEGLLYGDEEQGSVDVSVAYKRNLGATILVDDFSAYPVNALGFANVSNGMSLIETGSCYDEPFLLPNPIEPIHNLIMILPLMGPASLQIPLGSPSAPLDVTNRKRLTFRLKNHDIHGIPDNFGLDWLDLSISLADANGDQSILSLSGHLPGPEFHPDPEPATVPVRMKYQRFMTVTIDLDDFLAAEPDLDLDALIGLGFQFVTDGTEDQPPRVGLDDIQFE